MRELHEAVASSAGRSAQRLLVKSFLAVALLVIAGCSTQNRPGIGDYLRVPSRQVFDPIPEASRNPDNETVIKVKRDPGFLGSALVSVFTIDGRPVAIFKAGQYLELRLVPREYVFGVSWSDGLGAIGTTGTREVAIDCKAGNTYVLRMFPQVGNGIAIERASW